MNNYEHEQSDWRKSKDAKRNTIAFYAFIGIVTLIVIGIALYVAHADAHADMIHKLMTSKVTYK